MAVKPEAKYTIRASDKTKAGIASAKKRLKSFTGVVFSAKSAIAGLVGVGGFGALVGASLKSGDALAKTADKLQASTENLRVLHEMTKQYTSAGLGAMDEALTKASKRLGEFNATGGGAAAIWLKELGLDTQHLAALKPSELFNEYAVAIGNLDDRGAQLAATSALMGDESRALIGIIDNGTGSFEAIREELDILGVTMSRIDAAKMEAANDAFDRAGNIIEGLGNTIAIELSGPLADVTNRFVDAAKESRGFKKEIQEMTAGFIGGLGTVLDKTGQAVNFLSSNPLIGQLGLVGLVFLGRKGLAAGAAIGAVVDKLNRDLSGSVTEKEFKAVGRAIEGIKIQIEGYKREIKDPGVLVDFFSKLGYDPATKIETLAGRLHGLKVRQLELKMTMQGNSGEWDSFQKRLEDADSAGTGLGNTLIKLGNTLQDYTPPVIDPAGTVTDDGDEESPRVIAKAIEDDVILNMEWALQEKLADARAKSVALYESLEKRHSAVVTSMREGVANRAVGLLVALGQKSKIFAKAAILLEKGIAIQRVLIQSKVAAMAALTPPPIGLGPVSGQGLAASIRAAGYASAGFIGATGVVQLSNLGDSGSGVPSGSTTNPVVTQSAQAATQEAQQPRVTVHVNVHGSVVGADLEEIVSNALRDGMDQEHIRLDVVGNAVVAS